MWGPLKLCGLYLKLFDTLQNICLHPKTFDKNTRTKIFGINNKIYLFYSLYKFKLLTETLEIKCLCLIDAVVLIQATIKNLEDVH